MNNRRNFLKKSLAGAAGLSILPSLKAVNNETGLYTPENKELIYRTLGRTGIKVPIVSMGVMNANIPAVLKRSYEKGIRLFDTAWFYQNGMNEKMVGNVIHELNVRDEVIISTKIFLKETNRDLSKPETKQLFIDRFNTSLDRLQTNYADILFYHASSESAEHNSTHITEAFKQLKDEGKFKYTGVSLHTSDDASILDEITKTGFYDVVMIMINAAMYDNVRLIDSIKNAADNGIGIIAMKTQCGGGGYHWKTRFKGTEKENISLNQKALLKWVMQHEYIATAIPGYTTFEQLEEDISVGYDLGYTEEEKKFLQDTQIKLSQSFCIRCGECTSTCPYGADIPGIMRTHMYAYGYNNMEHAILTNNSIAKNTGLQICNECDECVASCKRSINITKRIEELKELNFHLA